MREDACGHALASEANADCSCSFVLPAWKRLEFALLTAKSVPTSADAIAASLAVTLWCKPDDGMLRSLFDELRAELANAPWGRCA